MHSDRPPPAIDTTTADPARRYNFWLGGKDNFEADRQSADEIEAVFPGIRTAAVENRAFLQRTVQALVKEEGIRQILDVGTGLPTADNTHEVAQRLAPETRVVYVDNDPLVLVHARALLTSHPHGATNYIQADLRHPDTILTDPGLNNTLDLSQPVAVLLVAILHFLPDAEQAYAAVRTLMNAVVPGSYLVLSHATYDLLHPETADALTTRNLPSLGDFTPRTRQQIAHFFDGFDLLPPGLEIVSAWRPEPGDKLPPPANVSVYGAVAHKPASCTGASC